MKNEKIRTSDSYPSAVGLMLGFFELSRFNG